MSYQTSEDSRCPPSFRFSGSHIDFDLRFTSCLTFVFSFDMKIYIHHVALSESLSLSLSHFFRQLLYFFRHEAGCARVLLGSWEQVTQAKTKVKNN